MRIIRVTIAAVLAAVAFGVLGAPPALAGAAGGTQSSAGAAGGTQSSTGLHVIPFPGTPDAAASSDIIFSSLRPSDINSVAVVGSSSGPHSGSRTALPDGAGTAFTPTTPFTPGEQVHVTATLTSAAAGTASGDPGSTTLSFSFTVAVQTGRGGSGPPKPGGGPIQRFLSEPNLKPPVVSASSNPDTSSGDILLSPYHSLQTGPMILNPAGQLVWFDPIPGWTANLSVQRYRGSSVLTYWHESPKGAVEEVLLDHNYRPVAILHAADGYRADLHEFQLTPQGTALIDAVVPVRADLSSVGGSSTGSVADCVVQELDVKTGKLLWEWHMLGHVPLRASYERLPSAGKGWGYCHLNSIQQLPDGNLLISARHTWAVYLVDKKTGNIIWTLGGKHSNFEVGPGAGFSWQHDARLHGNLLTVFDDGWDGSHGERQHGQSAAKVIQLNTTAMTATLVHSYFHSPPLVSASQGNAQLLPNGNMFVGWGSQPDFSEYSSSGQQIFNGSFALGVDSYRAYRAPWQGQPRTSPSVALVPGPDGSTKVYASWNGATRVAAWRIVGGTNPHALRLFAKTQLAGFETVRALHSEPPYFGVQALDSAGHVLGSSLPAADPGHVAVFGSMAFVRGTIGTGAVPVGCFTGQACQLTLEITSGRYVLATHTAHSIPSGTGTLIDFKLSPAAIRRLTRARSRRLPVQVRVRDTSGASATVSMTLIPYAISGAPVHRSVPPAPTVQIVQDTGFVSSAGTGYIVAACHASVPCYVRTSVFGANNVEIARTAPLYLGADELGFLSFNLNSTGKTMLQKASGNQLPARITLSSGRARATGQIALVGYR